VLELCGERKKKEIFERITSKKLKSTPREIEEAQFITLASFKTPMVRRGQDLLGVAPMQVGKPREGPMPEGLLHRALGEKQALKWVTDGHGEGVLYDGSSYSGQWKNSIPHGVGTSKHPDGIWYEGTWENGKKEGQGILQLHGLFYEGDMRANSFHGVGKCTFANGDEYEGEFFMNKLQGEGTYTYANKETYSGQFHFDQFHGKGHYEFPDGRVYVGQYIRDVKSGNGILVYGDDRKYEGGFHNGKKHGEGKETNSEWTYEGGYEYNLKNGFGIQEWTDGRRYEGNWRDGKRSDEGEMIWPSRDKYEGQFKFNKMHGIGKYRFANGRVNQGIFEADMYIGPAPHEGEEGGETTEAEGEGE